MGSYFQDNPPTPEEIAKEDERIAFDPSKPPPRPLAELEAEHDAFLKELFKKAKPL